MIIRTVNMFCGAGGASLGVAQAIRELRAKEETWALNHWETAIATYNANFPQSKGLQRSLNDLQPHEIGIRRGEIDLIWGSPSCFTAGTLVLTSEGMKPIEEIKKGDLVLTHKGRWRRVVRTYKSQAKTCTLKGVGHHGLETTPEHPFYSKRITRRYPSKKDPTTNKRTTNGPITCLENPHWPKAENLGKTKGLWATPIYAEPLPFTSPKFPGIELNENLFYFLGVWIGDGYLNTKENSGEIHITEGYEDANETFRILSEEKPIADQYGQPIHWYFEKGDTAARLSCSHKELKGWIESNFGKYCDGKKIPGWMFTVQSSWKLAFIEGYTRADGCHKKRRDGINTVNKALAIGTKVLLAMLKKSACISKTAATTSRIKGRKLIGKGGYGISWTKEPERETVWFDRLHMFARVTKYSETGEEKTVYNIQVEEDESYVADGIVVHNCTDFTFASAGRPRNDQLRAGPFAVTNWTLGLMPKCVIVENVAEMALWAPLDENNYPIKSQEGKVFDYWREGFHVAGYQTDFRVLDCADYGDPTNRRRLFFVALHRAYGPITWPETTHDENPGEDLFSARKPWQGADSTLEPDLVGKPILAVRDRALGVNAKRMILEGIEKFGGVDTIIPHPRKRANARPASRPMPTITGTSNDIGICKIHVLGQDGSPFPENLPREVFRPLMHAIEENQTSPAILRFDGQDLTAQASYRMLNVRELARGQSFPDWFEFSGTQEDARLQIGNAVPSQTAKALAKNLLTQVTQPTALAA